MARKAAIQMSLGFIVAIVFAVVFLSLAIVWVNQFMGQISPLTDDLIQDARVQIRDTFSKTDTYFSVYPQEWDLARGKTLNMLAGVINKESDSQTHNFVINVISTKPDETAGWIDDSEFRMVQPVPFSQIGEFPITITPESSAPAGTYTFYVIACIDPISLEKCSTMEDQNYQSPKYFRINLD
jgi:hypothetical protein